MEMIEDDIFFISVFDFDYDWLLTSYETYHD
jgi:hypothetical protein